MVHDNINILVIRRDNIGDLVCTTPLLSALRDKFPDAYLAALVNSYNAAVLKNNPVIDDLFVYQKAKHRAIGEWKVSVWWRTLMLMLKMRKTIWDVVIVATTSYSRSSFKFAKWLNSKRVIAVVPDSINISDPISFSSTDNLHEVEAVMQLAIPLGINKVPDKVSIYLNDKYKSKYQRVAKKVIALHISARKEKQRWSAENFANLACQLSVKGLDSGGVEFLLFWSPGSADDPQHPGDDEKAEQVQQLCKEYSVQDKIILTPCVTNSLEELIYGLSLCDGMICSDGGAMHIAAALNKPIVALFGNSDAVRWHPWGVPYKVLQKQSQDVSDISVDEVVDAVSRILI